MSYFKGMFIMSDDDYSQTYWPKLSQLIDLLFTQSEEAERSAISYEEMYSCVYKCVCSARGPQLKEDLMSAVQAHVCAMGQRALEKQHSPKDYIEVCLRAFLTFNQAASTLFAVFQYMNRVMLATSGEDSLMAMFKSIFVHQFVSPHLHKLIGHLTEAVQKPFLVHPDRLRACVQQLHSACPECASASPQLFARFVPGVLPPAELESLPAYAAEESQLQRDLRRHPGFIVGDRGRKRQGSPGGLDNVGNTEDDDSIGGPTPRVQQRLVQAVEDIEALEDGFQQPMV
ncbi:hypothetical protein BOX15_Mlig010529g2 [Macrostomum lignano]|uniref:Cullin N-terminal domain-containing protein n=1 Tax=Macrostomum lignano TaxID=282301 RepID=A0A267EHE4_9PLAT|nr:hypothetical protein BOX15_Mlig010529g2 [Macrostomum lignano]